MSDPSSPQRAMPPTSQPPFDPLHPVPMDPAPGIWPGEAGHSVRGGLAASGPFKGQANRQPMEPIRSYSFDLREIVAVIPRELFSGVLPAVPRLTLQLPPEALDSTRNYLTTSLGTIWRACPVLFAQPVSAAADRMVVLTRPGEGVVSPFRIASPARPGATAAPREALVANVIARSVAPAAAPAAGVRHPFLQEPTHFGEPMRVEVPVEQPLVASLAAVPARSLGEYQERPATGEEDPPAGSTENYSPFLAALRDGITPVEAEHAEPVNPAPVPAPAVAPGLPTLRAEEVISFTLGELFGQYARESLPFDPAAVSPGWKVHFPASFVTRQLPSGRVVASLAAILEAAESQAKERLGALAGNEVEVAIPLRTVFERLPVPQERLAGEPASQAPEIFVEKGSPAPVAEEPEAVFPGRFEPRQTVLEPITPPRGDLADAPEYVGPAPGGVVAEREEVASLDELDDAGPAPGPVREANRPDEVDGLPARHVPDFAGLGFSAGPMADLELRAIFASQEVFTPQKAVERTAGLPGVEGVILFRRRGEVVAALVPEGNGRPLGQQIPSIYHRVQDLATDLGFAGSEVFTLHTSRGIVSFFGHGESCLAILHGERGFEPGMREKLMLISRGVAALLRGKEA